jgi:haloacetate dehalogenase
MQLPPHKKSLTIGSVQLAFTDSGEGPNQTVVFLHGWPESSHCWDGVIAEMRTSGYAGRCIAMDMKGLGHSSRSLEWKAYKKQIMAQEVLEGLGQLGISSFHLVGHDWGGVVAQEMAIQAAERIRRLVITNITLITHLEGLRKGNQKKKGIFDVDWYQSFMQTDLPASLIPGNEEAFLRHFLRSPRGVPPIPEDSIRQSIDLYSLPATPAAVSCWYKTLPLDTRRWLGLRNHKFEMPALLLFGNRDPVINMDYVYGFEKSFPAGRLAELDAGHFCQEERPAEFAEEILKFFDESNGESSPS